MCWSCCKIYWYILTLNSRILNMLAIDISSFMVLMVISQNHQLQCLLVYSHYEKIFRGWAPRKKFNYNHCMFHKIHRRWWKWKVGTRCQNEMFVKMKLNEKISNWNKFIEHLDAGFNCSDLVFYGSYETSAFGRKLVWFQSWKYIFLTNAVWLSRLRAIETNTAVLTQLHYTIFSPYNMCRRIEL